MRLITGSGPQQLRGTLEQRASRACEIDRHYHLLSATIPLMTSKITITQLSKTGGHPAWLYRERARSTSGEIDA
jgi:hypothetical protein